MRRIMIKALMWVALTLMSALALATVLLATQPGTRWVVAMAGDAAGVKYESLNGSLLTGLRLEGLSYRAGDTRVQLSRAQLQWQPLGILWGRLTIDELALSGVDITLPGGGAQSSGEPVWPSLRLPLVIDARQVEVQGLDLRLGERAYHLDRVSAALSWGGQSADIETLTVASAGSRVSLKGSVALDYPYDLEARLRWALTRPSGEAHEHDLMHRVPPALMAPELAGELSLSGNIEQLTDWQLALDAPAQIEGEGSLTTGLGRDPAPPRARLTLNAERQALNHFWFDARAARDMTVSARLEAEGWLDDYSAQLEGEYRAPQQPPLAVNLSARGDTRQIHITRSQWEAAGATLALDGRLGWHKGLDWQANARVKELDPSRWLTGWPGQIRATLTSRGQWAGGDLKGQLELSQLQGRLRGLAVAGEGQLRRRDNGWTLAPTRISLGANKLELQGHYGNDLSAEWSLAAPLLKQIAPALAGELQSTGTLKGRLEALQISGQLKARELKLGDYRVGVLTANAEAGTEGRPDLNLTLHARDLTLAGVALQTVQAELAGRAEDHRLQLKAVENDAQSASLTLAGGWDGQQWQGQLRELSLHNRYTRPIVLQQPVTVSAAAKAFSLGELCLRERTNVGRPGQLCLNGRWQAGEGASARLEVGAAPLVLAERWLKAQVNAEGYLTGGGALDWTPGEPARFNLNLRGREAALSYQLEGEAAERYPVSDLSLSLEQNREALNASVTAGFADSGRVCGSLKSPVGSDRIEGQLNAALTRLTPLETLLPGVRDIAGRIDASVIVGGRWQAPSVRVEGQLRDGTATLPSLGITLTQARLDLAGDQRELNLDGALTAGPGQLTLEATARNLTSADWQLEANLGGQRAQLMDTDRLRLQVTPAMSLTASAERLEIDGKLRVPHARAQIKTLPNSAVQVSSDVVVIDRQEPRRSGSPIPLYADVVVILGEDVRLNAAGLQAQLDGELHLNKTPARPLYTVGTIRVLEGKYQAYGQNLRIKNGTLSFQGPLDNPGLNITATRTEENVEVGLTIGGTLQDPVTEIFSNPAMSESNAMAILFTGKPLGGGTTQSEASMLVNAVAKLGIKRGQFLADDIASRLGLDELTIKAQDSVNDSQLWVGKYLTEDLYIHYAYGLFDSLSQIGLTYFITDNLRLEAESGAVQSADLMFQMER